MRLVLFMIVAIAVMALIQSYRHGCTFGSEDWFSCVVDNSAKEYYSALTPSEDLASAEPGTARASAM